MKWKTKLARILPLLPGLVIATLLLIIAINMAKSAVASRYSEKADGIMLGWSQQAYSARPANHEIEYVRKLLNRSIRLDSSNTIHFERLTQFHLWELTATAAEEDEGHRQRIRTQGLGVARESVNRRPAWPMVWLRLLVWKAEFNEVDSEFHQALKRCTTVGQWQYNLHSLILRTTLPLWDTLGPEDREILLQTGLRGLRQSPESVISILERYGRLGDVCRSARTAGQSLQPYCQP
jgi:hypothetical protein